MKAAQRSGVELLEESIGLLRRAPAAAWAWYLTGAVSFFGAALIYWSRMTGVTAVPDPMGGALLLALLFGLRQYSRAWFAGELYRLLSGGERARHRVSSFAAVWFAGIVRIPLLVIPFPVVIALFRNASVMAVRAENAPDAFSRAGALAARGGDQVTALLTTALASLVIWVNVFTGMLALPVLLQIFTGQDMVFVRNTEALVNSTVVLASLTISWCIVDVVLTAFYALRVFYGESEETGADLLGNWRRAVARAAVVAAILICIVPMICITKARAEEPLRQAIDHVLKEQPYQWREPPADVKEQNAFVRWTDNLMEKLRASIQAVKRGIARLVEWLRDVLSSRTEPKPGGAPPTISLRALSWLVIIVLVGALITLLVRSKLLQRRKNSATTPAVPVALDLEDPSVLASQLPEKEWIEMARGFAARGEFRMALRAWFLASLAFLASRELLIIARSKTNLDYLREVRRRARSVSGLEPLFASGIQSFEQAWYGLRDVSGAEVEGFAANFDKMRGLAGGA